MARFLEASCKVCRRVGAKLFLKGDRCYTPKCGLERRNTAPGQHGPHSSKLTDYGLRLREKQKLRHFYGIMEKQFANYFNEASKKQGVTGEQLIMLLESRLDHVASRMGFCANHKMSRQYVLHGHFQVNNKSVNIPSYILKEGDVVSVKAASREIPQILEAMEQAKKRGVPRWCEMDWDHFSGVYKFIPTRDDISVPVQEQLIVELYSK